MLIIVHFFQCYGCHLLHYLFLSDPVPMSISPPMFQFRESFFFFNAFSSFYEDLESCLFSFSGAGSAFMEDSFGPSRNLFLLLFWWVYHFVVITLNIENITFH